MQMMALSMFMIQTSKTEALEYMKTLQAVIPLLKTSIQLTASL